LFLQPGFDFVSQLVEIQHRWLTTVKERKSESQSGERKDCSSHLGPPRIGLGGIGGKSVELKPESVNILPQ
jgi:hypothetical protein